MHWVKFPITPLVERHLIANCVLVFLTLTVVSLRVWSRFLSGALLWWDDYLILFAVSQGIGMLVIQGMWTTMGMGHSSIETFSNIVTILKMLFAGQMVYNMAVTSIRMSVLSFYLRLFVTQRLQLVVKLTMGFVVLWAVGNILQFCFICTPFAAIYNPSVKGKCGNLLASYTATGVFNVGSDLVVLALPIPTVWSLHMPKPARIGLIGVFLLGLVVTIIPCIRLYMYASGQLHPERLTETMAWNVFWSIFEVNLGILCVSIPMLRIIWSRYITGKRESQQVIARTADFAPTRNHFGPSGNKRTVKVQIDEQDEELGHDGLYASNHQVHHESSVAYMGNGSVERPSSGGTDISLIRLTAEPRAPGQDTCIKVSRKWAVTHHEASKK